MSERVSPLEFLTRAHQHRQQMIALVSFEEKSDGRVREIHSHASCLRGEDTILQRSSLELQKTLLKSLSKKVGTAIQHQRRGLIVDFEKIDDYLEDPYFREVLDLETQIGKEDHLRHGIEKGKQDFLSMLEPDQNKTTLLPWRYDMAKRVYDLNLDLGGEYLYQPTSIPGVEVELYYKEGEKLPRRTLMNFPEKVDVGQL